LEAGKAGFNKLDGVSSVLLFFFGSGGVGIDKTSLISCVACDSAKDKSLGVYAYRNEKLYFLENVAHLRSPYASII
jgi:hypothetical protein